MKNIKRFIKALFENKKGKPTFLTKLLFMNTANKFMHGCISGILDRDDVILDVGAKDFLYTRYQDVKAVFGIDLLSESEDCLGWTKNELKTFSKYRNLYPIVGKAEEIPLKNNSFDKIVVVEVIEHVERDDLVVQELARVLKQDGKLFLTTPNGNVVENTNPYHLRHYTPGQLELLLKKYFGNVNVCSKFPNRNLYIKQYLLKNNFFIRLYWYYVYIIWLKVYGERHCIDGCTLVVACSQPKKIKLIENNKEDDVYNVMAKNQAFLPEKKPILSLSPFKGFYKAAVAISLDYETSALYGNLANLNSRMRGRFFSLINKIYPTQKDLTFCYGIGYAMRRGADNITRILQNYKVHATWFSTGHVLLEENKKGKAFRADKILPYATEKAGFNDNFTWRNNKSISFYEPYSDYKRYPYWYFGDQALKLKLMGEDIQCHTFSHPYVAMEPPEDVKIDIEDWQNAAEANGFKKAGILAFPFGSDAYRYYYQLNLKTMIEKDIAGQDSVIITLADEVIEILQDNGIELITRCGSKNKEECKGISYYNNSKLHYMSDLDITRWMKNPGSLDSTIKKIVDNKTTVNLWIHPSSVFTQEETKNFEILIRYLLDKEQKQEIWFTTISEIWDYFKKIEHCQLDITPYKEDKYKIVVENKNTSIIENLALDIVDPELCIIQRDDNIGQCGERALIKKVYPEKPYKFICQIKRQA